MEGSECSPQRQSLLAAIHRFNTATAIMDETIMVPSMLHDISPVKEECEDYSISNQAVQQKSLYDSYLLLKSLKHHIKWGNHQEVKTMQEHHSEKEEMSEDETGDLADQFQHHLRGLLSALTKLTKKANLLTNCYKKEIEIGSPTNKQHFSRSFSH